MPKTIRQQIRIAIVVPNGDGAAERWRSRYQRGAAWTRTVSGDSEAVYNTLCALGPHPDPNAVAAAIGNKSWTHPRCDSCNQECELAVVFDDAWGDSKPTICPECIDAATKLLHDPSPPATADRGR